MAVTYKGVTYETLTWSDLLLSANDRLRGLETDRFRLSVTPSYPNSEAVLADYDDQIAEARAAVAELETAVAREAQREVPPAPPA